MLSVRAKNHSKCQFRSFLETLITNIKTESKATAPWEDAKGWSVLVQRLLALSGTLWKELWHIPQFCLREPQFWVGYSVSSRFCLLQNYGTNLHSVDFESLDRNGKKSHCTIYKHCLRNYYTVVYSNWTSQIKKMKPFILLREKQ